MKSSNNDKAYTVSYKRVKEPALYPQMNQTYSFDVIVGSTTLQKSGTDLTTNIAIENSKEAYRFPAQFCRITSLKNLRCVCCKKGLPDDQCLTDPQYDVHFFSYISSYVAINSDSKIVGPTDQSCKQIVPFTDNLKVCVCPVGYPMNENCNFDEPISCSKTRPINSGVPLITFQDSAFQKPQPNNDKRIYINSQADNQYYSLKYEPIQGFADTRPNNKDSFLMNLTIGNIKSLNTQGVQKDGTVQFEAAIFKTYIFKNAFCSINDNNVVQCACCETNPDDNACVQQAPTLLSDVTFVFSSVVDAYGLITGSGKIQLNSRKELWLNGQKLKALFEQNFIIVLSTIKADKVTKIGECNPWSNCKLQMTDENLADDAILIRTQIQDSKASTLLRLELENGLIKSEQNTCTKLTQGCVCSNDHPADSNCPSVNPIACNLGIVNTNTVDGIPYPFEAFSIVSKTELKKPTTEMIYGYAKDKAQKFYSLVYTDMKTISETSVSVNLEIGPMSSAPVNQNDVMDVALNFDVNTNVIDFSTAKCVLMTSKKLDCFCAPVLPVFPTSTTREATTMTTVSTTLSPDNPCLNPSDVKTNDLCGILDHQINSTNLDQKVGETRDLLEKNQTTADDLNVVSQIVDKMANVQDASSEQRKNVLSLCDNVLAINAPTFDEANKQTKDRFLKSIDKIVTTSTDDLEYLNGNQFGLHKTSVGCQNDKDGWAGIADDGQKFKKTEETNDQVASIELDKSKLCSATTGESRGVYFVIFRNSKLFSQDDDETVDNQKRTKRSTNFQLNADDVKSSKSNVDRCKMQFHETNGMVLTSVLLDGNQTGSVNARMKFKKDTNATNLPTHSNLVVTWYDENDWSTERQCEMREENGEFVAHCNHLTSFALLIQRSSTDPILCNNFLDRLGFWLVIASTTCLCILFFIYLTRIIPSVKENILIRMLNNSLRPSADSFIVLYVCIMLLFYLLFLVFVDQSLTGSHIVCKLSAAVLYDLFLTALIVNLFQAWNLIRVCAWSSRMEYLLGILTRPQIGFPIALFLPFLTCLIIWFTDYGFFYRGDQYCWIRPQSIIYAVLIPVTIMLVNSIFTFIIFCLRMFPSCTKICGSSSSAVRISTGSKNKRSGKLQLFIAILFAQFVLGFPWLLQYPAMFSSTTTVWHYLFAILNGSNGIILLLMYIYGRAQAFRRIQSLNSINSGLGTVRTHDYDRSQ
ncbi:hypothetical protein M3Y94_01265300 [Aphelenchoides besseyi]|nr:hypothetical protein M3Y94_01265300 [Aphelenchoides besseyi]